MSLGILRPGSAAEQAGVKEGDKLLSMTPLEEVRPHPERPMELTVERDGQPLRIRYTPRGAPCRAGVGSACPEL
ncbi:hypothetical protein JQX13_05640 [Archangium violaceum]|uniref:PDZ domain-containing protein n=1 Tax=Archangium violaceum TaxID=83451 RepID=UPI00193B6283|nr:PDZ domain-containing protein [Archangium violaceum]QRK09615.1 hypothetical protein JQX13_05640 [Archangium violaceum]